MATISIETNWTHDKSSSTVVSRDNLIQYVAHFPFTHFAMTRVVYFYGKYYSKTNGIRPANRSKILLVFVRGTVVE